MQRDSFIFYRSFYESIKEIPNEEQLNVYKSITEYALDGIEPEVRGISKAIFTLIKPQIDANTKRYENGKKGGRKPKQNQTETKTKPNENFNVNENNNVNVNENKNVSDSCDDGLQKIIDFYNDNIGLITPYGIEVLTDYSKEMKENLIILAMKKSVEANKKTIQYIKGILNNWSKKGIKTVLEAEQEDKNFKQQSGPKKETKEERIKRLKKEWGVEDET